MNHLFVDLCNVTYYGFMRIDFLFFFFFFLGFFFFGKEFQPIAFALDDSSLSLDQDTNKLFGVGGN